MGNRDVRDVEDVREEINIIEALVSGATSTDEYLEAILRMLKVQNSEDGSGGSGIFGGINTSSLPNGFAGLAIDDIPSNNTGRALFDISGSRLVTRVEAQSVDIESGQIVRVIDDGNSVTLAGDVSRDEVFGGLGAAALEPSSFEVVESEEFEVSPGETKDLLDVDISGRANWYRVGTSSNTYTDYKYIVDGEDINKSPIRSPLGLFNNMFEFPQPLRATNNITVRVKRDEEAVGPADYVSKIAYNET